MIIEIIVVDAVRRLFRMLKLSANHSISFDYKIEDKHSSKLQKSKTISKNINVLISKSNSIRLIRMSSFHVTHKNG